MDNSTSQTVTWVSEPDSRGTVSLVWSCIITIFLCTWGAVHPNLPAQNDSAWPTFGRRLGYCLMVVFIPEGMVVMAASELTCARRIKAKVPKWTLKQCFFLGMGGVVLQCDSEDESAPMCRKTQTVSVRASTFIDLVDANIVDWPATSGSDIDDRSKADWIIKGISLAQVFWFVTQVIGRAVQKLPITTLELWTLSIVVSATFMFLAWWDKPYDLNVPVVIPTDQPLPKATQTMERVPLLTEDTKLSNNAGGKFSTTVVLFSVGAIQLVGWNFSFPTVIEMWLWRITGIANLAGTVLLYLVFVSRSKGSFSAFLAWLLIFLVLLCRLYACGEVFAGLRRVPAGVYITPKWSHYFPSFG